MKAEKPGYIRNRLTTVSFIYFPDIECGLPASIPHGGYDLLNGTVGYLSLVKYNCEEGYEMVGRALLTCDFDERWNGPPPRCESKLRYCPLLQGVKNMFCFLL